MVLRYLSWATRGVEHASTIALGRPCCDRHRWRRLLVSSHALGSEFAAREARAGKPAGLFFCAIWTGIGYTPT
jgi:hypothetical protein